MFIRFISILTIFIVACNKPDTNYYKLYLLPKIKHFGIESDEFKIIAIANHACQSCGSDILKKISRFNCQSIVIYDSVIYNTKIFKNKCSKVLKLNHDSIARINIPNIYGHRIYFIKKDLIFRVKELNTLNSDSIEIFLNEKF